ncbi:hypothetical protein [Sphingomonas jatrophae]|uniref:Uncharacterized protein n=1 Tax=Sphingomonas jatrophae TaxID=1166337 RepID=A0A1I6L9D6_9SPHN|nr:hypothetical protein [Sphingomonas jatrophae]SFS00113.1 hypothetical protein SAMN05192580_2476 [Sphingomonas jatrophae]
MSALALALLAAPAAPSAPAVAQLTIRQSLIVRVPARPPLPQRKIVWKEKKGPRCIGMDQLAGAVVTERDSVDLILRGGDRMRAEFTRSCPGLSFYTGFYVLPTMDRKICADRDSIRDRSGGECAVERFRRLVPVEAPAAKRR